MRRRRGSANKGGGAFLLVLAAIVGGPLWLAGALSGPPKPATTTPPISYVSLPAETPPPAPTALLPDPTPAARPEQGAPVERDRRKVERPRDGETLYVSGHKVPLRADPDAKGRILDRYGPGQAVEVLERGDGWIHVRHRLTQREGWIQAKRLRDEPPASETGEPEPPKARASPALGVAEIAKLLIAESIAQYPGPCACPYQSARNGSACGKRAAYVRPGGYAPLCYAKDITPEMVAEYRANH